VGGVPLFCRRYGLSGRDRILGVASVVGVGSVLVHALGDFPLQVASIQLYVAVLLGLLWAAKHWPGPARDSARAP
ncbi:MAG TPA: hypothetical protein VNO52_02635, partial [Methylomirabilota bacterium]|nr:hypothetical protein [Methylomirabilota bacterium]